MEGSTGFAAMPEVEKYELPDYGDTELEYEHGKERRVTINPEEAEYQDVSKILEDEDNPLPAVGPEDELPVSSAKSAPAEMEGSAQEENEEENQRKLLKAKTVDGAKFASHLSDEDEADEQEHNDQFRRGGYGSYAGYDRGGRLGGSGRADTLLDFIDEVSDGINSYLGYLEERHKGVVYDRHERAECARWRDLLRKIHSSANKRSKEDPPKVGVGDEEEGARYQPYTQWSSELHPCRPPTDVPFHRLPQATGATGDRKDRQKLAFSACFESGNLALAKSDSPTSYTLLLDFDVNTSGYTQWFYFAVRGGYQGHRVTFRIANMSKAESLFSNDRGMRPVVWSEKASRGWERGCSDVSYYPNEHRRTNAHGEHSSVYYTLEFSYTFEFNEDTVFFAYHYPYTYTYLQDFIAWLLGHPYISRFLHRGTLCRTIGGLTCDILEIGEDEPSKPLAVVTARVHPGESNSSWMVQGLLQFLCSPDAEAQALRDACTWLVVPMLNPDGVVQGNYRCGLAGADLNRAFQNPHRALHPTVWHLKERLRGRRIDVYLDLHGHSKREGIFLYGGTYSREDDRTAQVKLLPKLCSLASSDFKYYQCVFSIQDCKLTTARLVAFLQFGILHAYTVEASFSAAGPRIRDEEARSTTARPPPLPTEGGFASHTAARATLQRSYAVVRPTNVLQRTNSIESMAHSDLSEEGAHFCRTGSSTRLLDERPSVGSISVEENKDVENASTTDAAVPPSAPVPAPTMTPAEKENFGPSRLEMAGPTLLKSLFCCWQLTKGLNKIRADGYEEQENYSKWSHLHYERLTFQTAKEEFQKLLAKRGDSDAYQQAAAKLGFASGNESGSDSQPSDDEKSASELQAIHRRILAKLRRRGDSESDKTANQHPEPMYKTVIAFGKTLRLPIVNGRLAVPDLSKNPAPSTAGRGSQRKTAESESGGRPRSAPSAPARGSHAAVRQPSPMTDDDEPGIDDADEGLNRQAHSQRGYWNQDAAKQEPLRQAELGQPMDMNSQAVLPIDRHGSNATPDHFVGSILAMQRKQEATVLLDNKSGAVVRHRSDEGCYGPSDVRSFVEVKSIKPQNSASRRAAAQLRKPLAGPPTSWRDWAQQRPGGTSGALSGAGAGGAGGPSLSFSLPPASAAHPGQKRSPGQALHRVVLEKPSASTATATTSAAPVPAVSGSAALVSDTRQQQGGARPSSDTPERPQSSMSTRRKSNTSTVHVYLPSPTALKPGLPSGEPSVLRRLSDSEVPRRPSTALGTTSARDRYGVPGSALASGHNSDGDMLDSSRRDSGVDSVTAKADIGGTGGTAEAIDEMPTKTAVLDEADGRISREAVRRASREEVGRGTSRRDITASSNMWICPVDNEVSSHVGEAPRGTDGLCVANREPVCERPKRVLVPADTDTSSCEGVEPGGSESETSHPRAAELRPRAPSSAMLMHAGWRPVRTQGDTTRDELRSASADAAVSSDSDARAAGVVVAGSSHAALTEAATPLSNMLAGSALRPRPATLMETRSASPGLAESIRGALLSKHRAPAGSGHGALSASAVTSTTAKAPAAPRPVTSSFATGAAHTCSAGPGTCAHVAGAFLATAAVPQSSTALTGNSLKDKEGSSRRGPGLVGSGAGATHGISTTAPSGTKQLMPPRPAGTQGTNSNLRSGRAAQRSGANPVRGSSAGAGAAKPSPRAPVYHHLLA